MNSLLSYFLFIVTFISCNPLKFINGKDWWEGNNFYQIYPRSFKDSNGDGIGDLNGITEKLEYLKDIGIKGVWLSPIFKSPMKDFGYDISDYYQIQAEYGTIKDFENLVRKANKLNLKIIIDFVPNHTSDEHEWFKRSVKRDGKYTDYYIWRDGIVDPNDPNKRLPPTNWVNQFRHTAWTWNDERKQFYYHQFGEMQPDLNYRSPYVVEDMKNILRYWLNKGIGGFRIDAVPYLFEQIDDNGNFMDEPLNPSCSDYEDYCRTIHNYTLDQPETYDMIYQWRELLEEYKRKNGGDTKLMMTEAYTGLEATQRFYGDGKRNGSHIPFNFEIIKYMNRGSTAIDYSNTIDSWLRNLPNGVYPNWVIGNHDNKRVASRLGENKIDLLNIMVQTLPGIAITYNGEEIGMHDVWISWEDTVDPQACSATPQTYHGYSRDPARTPFQWDDSSNAGFSKAKKTWLPVADDYKVNNVKKQLRNPRSHLNIFKELVKIRHLPTFQDGNFKKVTIGTNIIAYRRALKGHNTYYVILNFGTNEENVDLTKAFDGVKKKLKIVVSSDRSHLKPREKVNSNDIKVDPEVGVVLVSSPH